MNSNPSKTLIDKKKEENDIFSEATPHLTDKKNIDPSAEPTPHLSNKEKKDIPIEPSPHLTNKEKNEIPIEHITEEDCILIPRHLYHYESSQINKMLQVWLKDRKEHDLVITDFFFNQLKSGETVGWLVNEEKEKQKNTALFKVARLPHVTTEPNKRDNTLDQVLNVYVNKNIPCKKLVIPIEEPERKHFRLLVIKPEDNTALLYDAKSWLTSQPNEIYTSALSVFYADAKQPFYKLPSSFIEKYYYVENICQKYFPGIQFTKSYLGHQQWNRTKDCTPYIVEYTLNETLNDTVLTDLEISVEKSREKHSDLFFKNNNEQKKLNSNQNRLFYQITDPEKTSAIKMAVKQHLANKV